MMTIQILWGFLDWYPTFLYGSYQQITIPNNNSVCMESMQHEKSHRQVQKNVHSSYLSMPHVKTFVIMGPV